MTTYDVHQILHGYKDGHRQIRSSLVLSPASERQILILSDNSGVLPNSAFDGYLTGFPLKEEAAFALSRTWTAPEMKRPGCVWTHTLLVPNDLIIDLIALTSMGALHKRPSGMEFEDYAVPIKVSSSSLVRPSSMEDSHAGALEQLMLSFYQVAKLPLLFDVPSTQLAERLIMSIWAQCWPRLRLSLSFCSATISPRLKDGQPLALQGVAKGTGENFGAFSVGDADWIQVILGSDPTQWHIFLRDYAMNMVARPGLMPPMAKVYEHLQGQLPDIDDLLSTARAAMTAFGPESKSEKLQYVLVDHAWDNPRVQRGLLAMLLQEDSGNEQQLRSKILHKFREVVEFLPDGGLSFVKASYANERSYRQEMLSIWARKAGTRKAAGVLNGRMLLDLVDSHADLLERPETWRSLGSLSPAAFASVENAKICERKFATRVARGLLVSGMFEFALPIMQTCRKHFFGEVLSQLAHLKKRMGDSTYRRWVDILIAANLDEVARWVFENPILAASMEPALVSKNLQLFIENPELVWNLPIGEEDVVDVAVLASDLDARNVNAFFVRCGPRFSSVYDKLASNALSPTAFELLDSVLPEVDQADKWDTCERMRQWLLRNFLESSLDGARFAELGLDRELYASLTRSYLAMRYERYDGSRLDEVFLGEEERLQLASNKKKKRKRGRVLPRWLNGDR